MSDVDVSIVVVSYNTVDLLPEMFSAVEAATGDLRVQIVVVDNASRDASVELLRQRDPPVELIQNSVNVGFGRANNQALALTRGRFVLLLNTDAFVDPGGIERSVRSLDANPRWGVLGARLLSRDGTLQPSCRYFPTPWNEFLSRTGLARFFTGTRLVDDMDWSHDTPRLCDWVTGCFYLVRREVIDAVGLFDPRFFLYYEEVDHCRAVKAAGWQVAYFPGTSVVHIGGESAKLDAVLTSSGRQISALQVESGLLYFRKHHGLAGVLLAGVLATVGDALLAAKWVVQERSLRLPTGLWSTSHATWRAIRQTSFGRRPTR